MCSDFNKKYVSRYWRGNVILLVGLLPVLLLARRGNMDFEIFIIEVEKDLLFGIPETQNILVEI